MAFFAIKPPTSVRAQISSLQEGLKQRVEGVEWVLPIDFHITVYFAGGVEPGEVPRWVDLGQSTFKGRRAFKVKTTDLGIFQKGGLDRILWLGVDQSADLIDLYNHTLRSIEGREDPINYTPHITLGRVKNDALYKIWEQLDVVSSEWKVDSIHFMKRDKAAPQGLYSTVASYPLVAKQT